MVFYSSRKISNIYILSYMLISILLLLSCNNQRNIEWLNIEKDLQTEMIMAEDGDTIRVPAGYYKFTSSISLDEKNNVVIMGEGKDKTILSFEGQTEGAEGLRVSNGKNITVQDLTIEDTKGDAIKTQDIAGMNFINVRITWSGKPKESNGAYGLYPVLCTNVLFDGCEVSGASDAGIYVGQSKYVVVKNCTAFHNVAGIEIENTLYADVYNNYSYDNTGGILVFDLPDLKQKKGGQVRIFNNRIEHNNYRNFAPPGNIVGKVPAGTGFMILATSNVEVFNNKIFNNKTANASLISYFTTQEAIKDSLYDPYSKSVSIHNNEFKKGFFQIADWRNDIGKLVLYKFWFSVPDILFDGIKDPKSNLSQLCLEANGKATFANLDAGNKFKNISTDITKHACKPTSLPEVKFVPVQEDTIPKQAVSL